MKIKRIKEDDMNGLRINKKKGRIKKRGFRLRRGEVG